MTIADLALLARRLVNTNSTAYTDAQLLLDLNNAYERLAGKLLRETAGGNMPWGDMNYTTFPTFAVTMTNSTAEYDLRDWLVTTSQQTLATSTPLVILGAEVQDNNGNWHVLKRITLRDIHDQEIGQSDYQETDGLPKEYEIRDNLLVLYPAPDNGVSVTLSNGLRLYYLRSAEVFSSLTEDSSAKEPGFPRPYHDILAYEAAYVFAITNGLPNAAALMSEVKRKERELFEFIGIRDQDARPIMTTKGINYF